VVGHGLRQRAHTASRWVATTQAEIAAAGGADHRSAKNASAGMHQSREAHLAERSLHSPEGELSWTDERSRGCVGTPSLAQGMP
jgi:hypothetical protein